VLPSAFYVPDGDGYESTPYTRGPWNPGHQHAGPPAALLARAAVRTSGIAGGQTVRLSFDILQPIPVARVTAHARVVRPGRNVEHVEATLQDASGATLMRLTCWRMRAESVGLPDADVAADPPPPPPETGSGPVFGWWTDEVAYHRALDWRRVEGDVDAPGPATCWTRLRVPLVAGEEPAPLERLLVMADAASGVSAALPWDRWLFVNVDLGIHLERPPEGEWMAMAARTRLSPAGGGQCVAVLHDARGRIGVSTQALLVRPRQAA
jgi:Thioesterase-like superfamily